MSISSYASDLSAASPSHSCEITQSNPSPQSGMVQPVVNEMFATVHAAGSSLLGLFTSCATFDSTSLFRACNRIVKCKKQHSMPVHSHKHMQPQRTRHQASGRGATWRAGGASES
eukprot:scaffold3341_cov153-Isochrysis_galbana.AAC.2